MNKIRRYLLFFILSAILVGMDQWTKHWAVSTLKTGTEISLIPHTLSLVYVENPGAAFGILHGQQGFFWLITMIVLTGILYVLWKLPLHCKAKNFGGERVRKDKEKSYCPLFIALCFVFSGAIGNFIDRQLQSYVVDFIYFSPIDFPVFNVADIYVTCASFLLVYLLGFYYKEEDMGFLKKTSKQNEAEN